ncbi:UNVERIFIED_CONTAM: GTP cyclohydrolase II [Siphonaria sp. JEL0065]|nr:GTP cyclohydrolase II [Siphonaria sp. JEL0065]
MTPVQTLWPEQNINDHHNHSHKKTVNTSDPNVTIFHTPASVEQSPSSQPKRIANVQCHVRTRIPSEYSDIPHSLLLYTNDVDNEEHLALVFGYEYSADPGAGLWSRSLEKPIESESERDRYIRGAVPLADLDASPTPELESSSVASSPSTSDQPPLARIHSCCFTGETLGSVRCDCREQLVEAMKQMGREGRGVILYLIQEGRGIGLREKMKAYNLIDRGYDTEQANLELGHLADARSYLVASAILRDLQIPSVRLLTNNPHKMNSMAADGVVVSERVPMIPASWSFGGDGSDRDGYLVTKVRKMGHILDIPEELLKVSKFEGQ